MTALHTHIYQQILGEYLEQICIRENDIDPIDINRAKFYTRAIFIAYVFVQNENGVKLNIDEVYNWISSNISNECLFVKLINDSDPSLLSIVESYDIPIYDGNVGLLYEQLLNIETSGLKITKGKEYRNNLGSYYTPQYLADVLITKTINQYINNGNNDILDARIVDFSCGAGIFLTGAIEYITSLFNKEEQKRLNVQRRIACNIFACDVDCIALEITKLNILKVINDYTLYSTLSHNFYHGNFLMHSDTNSTEEIRKEITMNGFIYHEALSINIESLQKYDIILGNPPWEKIRFEEKVFYSQYTDKLHNINFKFELPVLIEQTHRNNSKINQYAQIYKAHLETAKHNIKNSSFFKGSNNGELNTCTLFANAAYRLLKNNGVAGLVVKSSVVTSQVNKRFFEAIRYNIDAIYDFVNKNKIFDIDGRERFCLLIIDGHEKESITLGMNLQNIAEINNNYINISVNDFAILNPETKMLPNLYSIEDFRLLLKIYNNIPVLSKVFKNIKYGRLVHLTNHIGFIDKEPMVDNIPVYEGKFFSLFDGSYSGFNDVSIQDRYKSKASAKRLSGKQKQQGVYPLSRFFIKRQKWEQLSKQYNASYMLAWHSLTSATNTRTCVATILPFMPASQSVQFLVIDNNGSLLYLAGIFNSIVFDYIVKCKLNGIDLTQSVLNQTPIPPIAFAENITVTVNESTISIKDLMHQICKLLLSSDARLKTLCDEFEVTESFLYEYSREELFHLLDIIVAKLYNLTPDEFSYILGKFKKQYSNNTVNTIIRRYMAFLD